MRGQDLNLRPLGYEPNELPDCSTPHSNSTVVNLSRQSHPAHARAATASAPPSSSSMSRFVWSWSPSLLVPSCPSSIPFPHSSYLSPSSRSRWSSPSPYSRSSTRYGSPVLSRRSPAAPNSSASSCCSLASRSHCPRPAGFPRERYSNLPTRSPSLPSAPPSPNPAPRRSLPSAPTNSSPSQTLAPNPPYAKDSRSPTRSPPPSVPCARSRSSTSSEQPPPPQIPSPRSAS